MQFGKLIMVILIFPSICIDGLPDYCMNTKTRVRQSQSIFAVPVFASNAELAQKESNSFFILHSASSISVTVIRLFKINNCSSHKNFIYNVREVYLLVPEKESIGFGKANCTGDELIFPLTSFHMADDWSLTLLISCRGPEINITVLAACFMIHSDLNLEQEVDKYLEANDIAKLHLFKIDFERRYRSYLSGPTYLDEKEKTLLLCQNKKKNGENGTNDIAWMCVLPIVIVVNIIGLLLLATYIWRVKRKRTLVSPSVCTNNNHEDQI